MCNEIGIRLEFDNADRPSSFRRKLTFELFSNVRNISFSYVGTDQLPLVSFIARILLKLN